MALNTISTSFIEEFESGVHVAYQRMGSKLRNTVRTRNGVKNKTTFQKSRMVVEISPSELPQPPDTAASRGRLMICVFMTGKFPVPKWPPSTEMAMGTS